jgi:hypothetical protein
MVVHTFNPSTQEADTGRLQIGGQPGLHIQFQVSIHDIVRPCLKRKIMQVIGKKTALSWVSNLKLSMPFA